MVFYIQDKLKFEVISASFHLQEYDEISVKRIQLLRNLRHRPDQFNVLVRQVPFCNEHNAYGCSVDHFFSKYHPNSYCSYQMIHDGKDIEDLMVRLEQLGISYSNALDATETMNFKV